MEFEASLDTCSEYKVLHIKKDYFFALHCRVSIAANNNNCDRSVANTQFGKKIW